MSSKPPPLNSNATSIGNVNTVKDAFNQMGNKIESSNNKRLGKVNENTQGNNPSNIHDN